MKFYITIFCSFTLLISVLVSTGYSQSSSENALIEILEEDSGPDQIKALETVLRASDQFSPIILFLSAKVAFKEKRLEDSGFLLCAGQLRVLFDKECFPPKGKDGNSPLLVFAVLSQQLGSQIKPAVATDPKLFANVIERLKIWIPKAPKEYEPGYEYTERKSEKETSEALKQYRTEYLNRMEGLSSLLNDPKYLAAFRVMQKHRLAINGMQEQPTEKEIEKAIEAKKEIEKAMEIMKQIERDKGIKVLFNN